MGSIWILRGRGKHLYQCDQRGGEVISGPGTWQNFTEILRRQREQQQSDEALEKQGERGEANFQRVNVCKWFLQNNCLEMKVECKSDICISRRNL